MNFTSCLFLKQTLVTTALTVVLALAGCHPARNIAPVVELQHITYPTAIDHWPAQKKVIVGSFAGHLYSMQDDGTGLAKLLDIAVPDCARVIRTRVDTLRNRLWVMSAAGICIYDLQSRQLMRVLPIADMGRYRLTNGLSDLALDSQGNAYAIDTGVTPIVYRVAASTLTVEPWNKPSPSSMPAVYSPRHFPLNAIAVTPDGKYLIHANAYSGTLHVADIDSRQQTLLVLPQALYAINALVVVPIAGNPGGFDLYALSAKNNAVTILQLDRDLKALRLRGYATKFLDNPMAGTLVQGDLWVTNSQLLQHPEIGGDRDTQPAFSIARLNAKYFAEQATHPELGSVLGQ